METSSIPPTFYNTCRFKCQTHTHTCARACGVATGSLVIPDGELRNKNEAVTELWKEHFADLPRYSSNYLGMHFGFYPAVSDKRNLQKPSDSWRGAEKHPAAEKTRKASRTHGISPKFSQIRWRETHNCSPCPHREALKCWKKLLGDSMDAVLMLITSFSWLLKKTCFVQIVQKSKNTEKLEEEIKIISTSTTRITVNSLVYFLLVFFCA